MGDYKLGWSCLYNFSKMPGLTPYLMQFLMLIMIRSSKFTFSKKKWGTHLHFWSNNNIGGQKFQKVKLITTGVLRDVK